MYFQTEKQLKELGDKIPAEKLTPITEAVEELKKAHADQNIEACKAGIEKLNNAFQAASQEMYAAQGGAEGDSSDTGNDSADDQEVTDVDFEEVKED